MHFHVWSKRSNPFGHRCLQRPRERPCPSFTPVFAPPAFLRTSYRCRHTTSPCFAPPVSAGAIWGNPVGSVPYSSAKGSGRSGWMRRKALDRCKGKPKLTCEDPNCRRRISLGRGTRCLSSSQFSFLKEVRAVCDYSLMAIPNRLAVSGEDLVVHRFEAGVVGLASAFDLRRRQECRKAPVHGFWSRLKEFFDPPHLQSIPAVCIPPGARLLVQDIPATLQHECGFQEEVEEAVFTQTTAAINTFRDAVRFQNGVRFYCRDCTRARGCAFWIFLRRRNREQHQRDASA